MINPIIYTTTPPMNEVVGGWLSTGKIELEGTDFTRHTKIADTAFVVDDFLSKRDCADIIAFMKQAPNSAPVSVQGNQDYLDNKVGSIRTTMWNTSFAEQLWKLFDRHFGEVWRIMDGQTLTDWWQHGENYEWKTVAISPMIRYMKYQEGGQHYAHYDAAYIYPDTDYRSLMSIVIYLTDNETGCTRFIRDGQTDHIKNRIHDDWTRETKEEEILAKVKPRQGRMLIFDHRMCHDVEKYDGSEGDRIIIRGDLIFKAIK